MTDIEISNRWDETNKLLKKQIELLEKIYLVFSKYDEQYITEMESEGLNLRPEGK